jgi:phage shock protein C
MAEKKEKKEKENNNNNLNNKKIKNVNNYNNEYIESKRIFRSDEKIIAGVFGGIAEYFNISPFLVRLIGVLLLFYSFKIMILAYIIAWIIIPKKEDFIEEKDYINNLKIDKNKTYTVLGISIIFLGSYLFLNYYNFNIFDYFNNLIKDIPFELLIALSFIILGVFIILKGTDKKKQ